MSIKIQIRRGTSSEWDSANPTLASGELGYDSTNDILKVGDGSSPWNSLPDSDDQNALQTAYDATGQTFALGATVQDAIHAIDDELIVQDGRLDVVQGDASTSGSIAKAEADARAHTDTRESAITTAYNDAIDAAKLALGTNFSVADITARDALVDLTVGDIIFVADNGDGKFAQYKVTVASPNEAFLKIMDEDILLNALSAANIKSAYEGNDDTNAFTDALLSKVNAIEANAKDDQNAEQVDFNNSHTGYTAVNVQAAVDELYNDIDYAQGQIDIVEGDDQTTGSIAKALKDAKDYADQQDALQDAADEISYDDADQTYAIGINVQGALYAIDDELIAQDGRLDVIEGDVNTTGSLAKTLQDAKDYTDTQDALQDAADEISYDQTGQTYALGSDVQAALYAVDDELISLDGRLDTVEGDDQTAGSIAKALKDAKDYADQQDALQDDASEISYDNVISGLTSTDVKAALDEIAAGYEPADATILKAGDIGVTVQAHDANTLKSGDIGVTVQGYDANTVVDANYENFDSSTTYANLRAQATTAEDVGLGNVTNESKSTMFTDPTLTGTVTVPDPVASTDAANRRYVDEVAEGLRTAPAVEVATTENLSGTYNNGNAGVGSTYNLGMAATLTIDGDSTWSLYDGVLLKDQTNKFENGRYFVSQLGDVSTDWILTRCPICDEADEIPGRYVFVKGGAVNNGTGWVQIVDDPDTFVVGTDDIDVYQFSGAGTYTAGSGLDLVGNEFALSEDSFDADGTFASLRAQGTTKEDVGLTNVTDDAQVKKATSSTDGHIPKWDGTDGDAIVDGYGVQTTLSDTATDLVRADAIVAALLDKADKLANIIEKTASFTVDTTEDNKVVVVNTASNITITLPTDAANANLAIGTQIAFIRNGSGTVTFASSATILSDGSKKSIKAQYTSAAVVKIASNTWQLVGNLAT